MPFLAPAVDAAALLGVFVLEGVAATLEVVVPTDLLPVADAVLVLVVAGCCDLAIGAALPGVLPAELAVGGVLVRLGGGVAVAAVLAFATGGAELVELGEVLDAMGGAFLVATVGADLLVTEAGAEAAVDPEDAGLALGGETETCEEVPALVIVCPVVTVFAPLALSGPGVTSFTPGFPVLEEVPATFVGVSEGDDTATRVRGAVCGAVPWVWVAGIREEGDRLTTGAGPPRVGAGDRASARARAVAAAVAAAPAGKVQSAAEL